MGKNLSERQAFELQAYLAPLTREFGCLGVDRRNNITASVFRSRVVSFEERWAALHAKVGHMSEVANFVEELMNELREIDAA